MAGRGQGRLVVRVVVRYAGDPNVLKADLAQTG